MITLTRLNGHQVCLNADLIERVETTPDTVVTLGDGKRYVVREPMAEVVDRVVAFRAAILALAGDLREASHGPVSALRLVPSEVE